MNDAQLTRWAELLTGYCLELAAGEMVLISAGWEARPLVEACFRAAVARGAYPLLRMEPPGLLEHFIAHAPEALLDAPAPLAVLEAERVQARIRIEAESDTRALARVDAARQARYNRGRDAVRRASAGQRWVLTQFPTAAYAADADMPLDRYEAFVAGAMFLDDADPASSWRALGFRQAGLVDFMTSARVIRIECDGTDLTLDVSGRRWINSDGRRNMPSGEIFTGPIESSARGRLRCAVPVQRDGRRLEGIELQFQAGVVTAARADVGDAYLNAMLDLDDGARRVGELGIGLNHGIERFTGSILYDEKIGGTIHVALGRSYSETGGRNESALHWDLIVDTRQGGRVTVDGRVAMENGRWLVG